MQVVGRPVAADRKATLIGNEVGLVALDERPARRVVARRGQDHGVTAAERGQVHDNAFNRVFGHYHHQTARRTEARRGRGDPRFELRVGQGAGGADQRDGVAEAPKVVREALRRVDFERQGRGHLPRI